MANFAILRIEKRKDIGSIRRCAEHHLRAVQPPNADPEKGIKVLCGSSSARDVVDLVHSITKPLMKRKDAVRVLDIFMGASPDYFISGGLVEDFEQASMKWAIDTFGIDNIISMVTHLDETSPHCQLLVLPVTPAGKLAASHWLDGPEKLRKLQDSFAEHLSHLGLERGIRGSKAVHQDIKTWYGKLLPAMREAEAKIKEAMKMLAAAGRVTADLERQKAYVSKVFHALGEQQKRELQKALEERSKTPLPIPAKHMKL